MTLAVSRDGVTPESSVAGFTAATTETSISAKTPPTTVSSETVVDNLFDGQYSAVPWPDSTYMIIEKGSNRAITLTPGGLRLQDIKDGRNGNNHWLCVERNNYFGFYNEKSRRYLGHDGKMGMRASATVLEEWEFMVPRLHPEGGYQLLLPFWSHTMMILAPIKNGDRLTRARHGTALWVFSKV
ncbi:hypothetical protein EDB81DRAFT_773946 [Dactylonectria macrodidyma]|uniref:Uncharacterized protein n=1 Tax=Dactylonectria macrodidyma TaxID=307937 RepID=A0A9P9JJT8_9HYPO|nr:hypothetical protein EDB81DRAFT_773946 [Dactylonectria macrodidyma]